MIRSVVGLNCPEARNLMVAAQDPAEYAFRQTFLLLDGQAGPKILLCTIKISDSHFTLLESSAYFFTMSSMASSAQLSLWWTRLRWLLKLSRRGHCFSLDLHPETRQRNFLTGVEENINSECLLLLCLSRSLGVLNPSLRLHPGTRH